VPRRRWQRSVADVGWDAGTTLAVLIIGGGVAAALLIGSDRVGTLSIILGVAALLSGLLFEGESGSTDISASFIITALAAAFLGPASAGLAALITELCTAVRLRTAPRVVFSMNLPACIVPAVGCSSTPSRGRPSAP
jgi:hypothetical protein